MTRNHERANHKPLYTEAEHIHTSIKANLYTCPKLYKSSACGHSDSSAVLLPFGGRSYYITA